MQTTLMNNPLKFAVYAATDLPPLAVFQYRNHAEKWRDEYCDAGIVFELEEPHQDQLADAFARRAVDIRNRPFNAALWEAHTKRVESTKAPQPPTANP